MQLSKLSLLRIPTRSIVTAAASSQRISSFVGSYHNLSRTRLMNIESYQYLNASRFWCQLNSKLQDLAQRVCHSPGCKLPLGTFFGLSIATGVLSSLPEYALAERDQPAKALDQSHQTTSAGKWEEGQSKILSWARKLSIPMLLVMTVVMGWNYPVSLAVNIVFLLLSTKPTPSSIYLWVEEVSQIPVCQRDHHYLCQSSSNHQEIYPPQFNRILDQSDSSLGKCSNFWPCSVSGKSWMSTGFFVDSVALDESDNSGLRLLFKFNSVAHELLLAVIITKSCI